MIATSRETRGGITSVIKAHEMGRQWIEYHCRWVETHIDKNFVWKWMYAAKAFFAYLFLLPQYDIVHVHLSEPPSAVRKTVFFVLAKLFHKKTIVHFHAFSVDTTINSRYRNVYKYLFRNADCVIVLSRYWFDELNEAFGLDNVEVIYNPCVTTVLTASYPQKKQILYAGTLNARKGYADMIKAFAQIAEKYKDWKVVFAGNGEIEQGRALARMLGIDSQVVFLGWVNGVAKDKAFKESAIFCLPSYAEGFPMAVLDAWAYGLPVITTPVGGIPDIAEEGKNLLLFKPGDISMLALQMERMIGDEQLRESLIRESSQMVQSIFSTSAVNEQIGCVYRRMTTS